MNAFTVKLIDASGVFHRYVQLAASCAAAEGLAFDRFGELRLLSVRRVNAQEAACRLFAVHHGLRVLYDAIGARCRDQHGVGADPLAETLHRMVDRMQASKAVLSAIAYPREAASVAASTHAPAPISVMARRPSTRLTLVPAAGKADTTAMEAVCR